MSIVLALLGTHYDAYPLDVSPADIGFKGVSRNRRYIYLVNKQTGVYLYDIYEAYQLICRRVGAVVHTRPRDYMIGTDEHIQLEAMATARSRGTVYIHETQLAKCCCFECMRVSV